MPYKLILLIAAIQQDYGDLKGQTDDQLDPLQDTVLYVVLIPALLIAIVVLAFWRRGRRTNRTP